MWWESKVQFYDRSSKSHVSSDFKRPKITVKKCKNLSIKVNFQCEKPTVFYYYFSFKNINLREHFLLTTF